MGVGGSLEGRGCRGMIGGMVEGERDEWRDDGGKEG